MFASTRRHIRVRNAAVLINTPLQRGVGWDRTPRNRFNNGFSRLCDLRTLLFCILLMTTSSITAAEPKAQTDPLQDFKKRAEKFHSVISLPQFEVTTNDVTSTVKKTISDGNAALDIIGALKPAQVTLRNTIQALDDAEYQIGLAAN